VTQQINLFNPALREKRSPLVFRSAVTGWAAAAALLALWAAWVGHESRSLQAQETAAAAQLESERAELNRLTAQAATRQRDPQIAAELTRLEAQVRDRHEVMDYLKAGELGDTRGFSEHFKALARQSFDGLWLTGLHIASSGNDMTLEGRALRAEHVPGYLKRLNGESIMQGHPFSELVIERPKADEADPRTALPAFVEFRIATRAQEKQDAKGTPQ
jgi:hypothetical protein